MKKNERGLKKRIARFFLRIGNKCKILSYPITFLMVAVLAVYHTIRKIFIETQYRKLRLGVLTTLCVAVVIGAVVVLPTLASEMEEALMTEVVTEEELEPEETPELATIEPQETEVPETESETPEPTEEAQTEEPESSEEPESLESPKPQESENPEVQKEEGNPAALATPEASGSEKKGVKDSIIEEVTRQVKTQKMLPEPIRLEAPTYEVTADGTGQHTYPLSEEIKISIRVSGPAGAGIDYQWYMRSTPDGIGEILNGNGARSSTYKVPTDIDAGDYYFYCVIKSIDNDGEKLDSEEVQTSNIVVSVGKGEPELEDFDTSAIEKEYYYTGEAINPPIVSACRGMGKAYIVVKDGDIENRPKVESDEAYPIYLHVSEGTNYKAKTLDLDKSIMIRRIATPRTPYNIKGTRGKNVDGKQWYTSAVSIVPATGYTISTTETDFKDELVYSDDGLNQGPNRSVVYLCNKNNKAITSAVTITEKRDGVINIDTTNPTAEITYDQEGFSGNSTNRSIAFQLEASDEMSGIAARYYYKSKIVLSEAQLKSAAWKEWHEGESITEDKDGTFYLYAKVEDKAGNISYQHTDELTIDTVIPTISCNGTPLENEKTFVADKKIVTIQDDHLRRVIVTRNGNTWEDKSGDDIVDGTIDLTLNGPTDMATQIVYEITAQDWAGNQKVTTVTMKNPVLDIQAVNVEFGMDEKITYGYESVEPRAVVVKVRDTGEKIPVNKVEIEEGDSFEIVPGTNTVRPKLGLNAGTHSAVLRVYFGVDDSTITCRCTATIQQAKMLVRYTGQEDVGYHTYPDLEKTFEFMEADFRNGDTLTSLKTDPNFVMPALYYQDDDGLRYEFTSDMRALKTVQLIPDSGRSTNYAFEYEGGELEVNRHALRRGYVINGEKKEGYDWYTSSVVSIRPAEDYYISRSDAEDSFQLAGELVNITGPTMGSVEKFYVMNRHTGEISSLMTEVIRIDNSAPYFRTGEGINVSSNLFAEFGNAITFGAFFNDTKEVSISATDEESGIKSIEYTVADRAVGIGTMDKLDWTVYDGSFSISPEEYDRAVIYAKITNNAGIETYISSNGMVFDNKQPDINILERGKEQGLVDEKEYFVEELDLKVSDRNLTKATVFDGTNTAVSGSSLQIEGDEDATKVAQKTIACPKSGSKTYTVVASDGAGNNIEREFTITKPIYDIKADTLKIKTASYGYQNEPKAEVIWSNTQKANAKATITDISINNKKNFDIQKNGERYWVVAKPDLGFGTYTTNVTLLYNGGKKEITTCSFDVEKAVLTATYLGDDLYYNEKIKESSVKVSGFVKHNGVVETKETAAGYKEPKMVRDGLAVETSELAPYGGEADNYSFEYESGLLLVERRDATTGKDGQYFIDSKISDSGWYTSDVVIRPKEGYAFLLEETDEESLDSITLSEDTDRGEKSFYVKNIATGEIYNKSTLYYKKDTKAPVIDGIDDEATYEANTKEVSVEDEYLTSITVNGEAQTFEHGKAQFTLTAKQKTMVYIVVATDCAGNVTDKTIVMNQPESLPVDSEENKDTLVDEPLPTTAPATDQNPLSKEGTIKKLVKIVQGAPNTSLTTSTTKLKDAVLTGGEREAVVEGSDADIELRIKNLNTKIPQNEKELIIANLDGYSIGEYLDITLWKKVGSSSEKKVTNTNKPLSITVTVPKSLQRKDRKFVVFRIHNNKVTVLPDLDSAMKTVTFTTDRFSTYVLAYKKDSKVAMTETSELKSKSNSWVSYSDYYPEMGDEAPIVPVTIVFVVALFGIIITLVVRRKTR